MSDFSEGSYLSRSEPGNPKLKAAFLSPNTSFRFALFNSVPLTFFFKEIILVFHIFISLHVFYTLSKNLSNFFLKKSLLTLES